MDIQVSLVLLFVLTAFIAMTISSVQANTQDQDCSEGEIITCGSNIGACRQGIRVCEGGQWSDCLDGIEPVTEVCSNKVDDDCDGFTDECGNFIWMIMLGLGMLLFAMGIAVANKWTD